MKTYERNKPGPVRSLWQNALQPVTKCVAVCGKFDTMWQPAWQNALQFLQKNAFQFVWQIGKQGQERRCLLNADLKS